jgi:hypothetical protein
MRTVFLHTSSAVGPPGPADAPSLHAAIEARNRIRVKIVRPISLSPNCEKFRDEGLKCLICGDPRSQFAAIEGSIVTMRLMCRTKSQGLANRVGPTKNRTVFFTPDGPGFARLTVMDAKGAADSVVVRLQ